MFQIVCSIKLFLILVNMMADWTSIFYLVMFCSLNFAQYFLQTTDEMATDDAQVDSFLDPGPVDNSILVLQNQHRSEAIWMGEV